MSWRRRLLYVTEADISIDSGMSINEREFVNTLRKFHAEEVVCVVPYPSNKENHFDPGVEYVFNHRRHQPICYLIYLLSTFVRVIKLHRRHHFAAMIFRLAGMPVIPYIMPRFLKIPLILKTLSGYQIFSGMLDWKHELFFNRLFFPLYQKTIRRALIADTVSTGYIEWLHFKFGIDRARTELIPNGVNADFFRPVAGAVSRNELGLGGVDHVIGYVGSIERIRHLDALIASVSMLRAVGSVGAVIVGDGTARIELEKYARDRHLDKVVSFLGSINYQQVPAHISAFDVAVDLTLISMKVGDRVINASFSQKIAQYLACGVPVVAWDVADTRFIAEEGVGKVVPYGDLNGLADSLKQILSLGPKDREAMRHRARSYAETHLSNRSLTAKRIGLWRSAAGLVQ